SKLAAAATGRHVTVLHLAVELRPPAHGDLFLLNFSGALLDRAKRLILQPLCLHDHLLPFSAHTTPGATRRITRRITSATSCTSAIHSGAPFARSASCIVCGGWAM